MKRCHDTAQIVGTARVERRRDGRSGSIPLVARALVYLVVGWIAIQIARGHNSNQANQRGALADIAKRSYGTPLLWVVDIGLAAYAIWRLSEAAFDTAAEGTKTSPRLKSLFTGIVYFMARSLSRPSASSKGSPSRAGRMAKARWAKTCWARRVGPQSGNATLVPASPVATVAAVAQAGEARESGAEGVQLASVCAR